MEELWKSALGAESELADENQISVIGLPFDWKFVKIFAHEIPSEETAEYPYAIPTNETPFQITCR